MYLDYDCAGEWSAWEVFDARTGDQVIWCMSEKLCLQFIKLLEGE